MNGTSYGPATRHWNPSRPCVMIGSSAHVRWHSDNASDTPHKSSAPTPRGLVITLPSHDDQTGCTRGPTIRCIAIRSSTGSRGTASGKIAGHPGGATVLSSTHWGRSTQTALICDAGLSRGPCKIHVSARSDTAWGGSVKRICDCCQAIHTTSARAYKGSEARGASGCRSCTRRGSSRPARADSHERRLPRRKIGNPLARIPATGSASTWYTTN